MAVLSRSAQAGGAFCSLSIIYVQKGLFGRRMGFPAQANKPPCKAKLEWAADQQNKPMHVMRFAYS